MIIILTALLAGSKLLPMVDRDALDLQARAEALQPRAAISAPARRLAPRRIAASSTLDLSSITTICRAAGSQVDPAAFIGRLGNAYALSAGDSASLRSSCAAYLAGRADARRSSGGGD